METALAMPAFPTSTTVLDSILFRDAFGTPRMREVFSDLSVISRYAEVEVALAKAEARCGVIPRKPRRRSQNARMSRRLISICCAARPISSAIRSCRWCSRW
jgi:hypothetical protein